MFVGGIAIRHVCRVAFMFFWGREARKKGCSNPTRKWIGLEIKFTEMIGLWKCLKKKKKGLLQAAFTPESRKKPFDSIEDLRITRSDLCWCSISGGDGRGSSARLRDIAELQSLGLMSCTQSCY